MLASIFLQKHLLFFVLVPDIVVWHSAFSIYGRQIIIIMAKTKSIYCVLC